MKIVIDRILGLILMIAMSPLMLLIAAAILLSSGPPVLFLQRRPGYRGRPFVVMKFRTMTESRDAAGQLGADEHRLTRIGRLLRSLSLDELPQLINVARGELSLVGPRPLLMQYLERYSPEQARRHEVLPGLTGWAQINGRNALSWDEKFNLDLWYVDHWSLVLDARILAMTLWSVLKREGISQPGAATMPEFMGNDSDRNRN